MSDAGRGMDGSRPAPDRARLLRVLLAIVALPAAVLPIQAVSFYGYNRDNGSIMSSGLERTYLLHVPARYDRSRPTPLVISLHGAGLWGVAQKDISHWNDVSDAEGFIVVYPSGLGSRGLRVWKGTPDDPRGRDVKFISELIDTLRATYNIDTRRVYANGLSNGGGMSFALSCALPDRIAAVGLVGSAQTEPWQSCRDSGAVPMINFHGTDDRFAAYHGGASWVLPRGRSFPSQLVWTANWARRNRCASGPVDSVVTADVTRKAYGHCANDADVVLYAIAGGGHTWPGGGRHPAWFVGKKTNSIDASRLMWEFFLAHPLRR